MLTVHHWAKHGTIQTKERVSEPDALVATVDDSLKHNQSDVSSYSAARSLLRMLEMHSVDTHLSRWNSFDLGDDIIQGDFPSHRFLVRHVGSHHYIRTLVTAVKCEQNVPELYDNYESLPETSAVIYSKLKFTHHYEIALLDSSTTISPLRPLTNTPAIEILLQTLLQKP